tara:strand:- start:43035 stop:43697 length:663 start_codon:yes stop_codon:yes gene_type:complete
MIYQIIYNTELSMSKKVKKIRKLYISFSILIGILSPLVIYISFVDWNGDGLINNADFFDPREKPLSYFGIIDKTSLVWTTLLIIVAIALFWGGVTRINQFFKDFKQKIILKSVVLFSFICLIMVALIPMNEGLWHKLPAILFFLSYNFFVFCFGLFRSFSQVRNGFFSVCIGSLMLLSTLFLIPFPKGGVSEILYIQLISFWNLLMMYKGNKRSNSQITS